MKQKEAQTQLYQIIEFTPMQQKTKLQSSPKISEASNFEKNPEEQTTQSQIIVDSPKDFIEKGNNNNRNYTPCKLFVLCSIILALVYIGWQFVERKENHSQPIKDVRKQQTSEISENLREEEKQISQPKPIAIEKQKQKTEPVQKIIPNDKKQTVQPKKQQTKENGPEEKKEIQKDKTQEQENPKDNDDKNIKSEIQKLKQKYPNLVVKQFNRQNIGKDLLKEFAVKLELPDENNQRSYEKQLGVFKNVQVASKLDYLGLTQNIDFRQLEKDIMNSVAHEVIGFQFDPKLEKPKELITMTGTAEENEMVRQVQLMSELNQMNFGIELTQNINSKEHRLKEFLHYDKKYKIGSNADELPICLYSASYNIFSKGKYRLFFESLQRQNYSNFHMVYVDDNSRDGSAYRILEHLNATGGRLNNRVQVVHNLQHMGALANMFFWIKKYCNEEDVVIIVDGDDSLAGTQTFQVLNALYRDPNLWYIYSRYLNHYPSTGLFRAGIASSPLRQSTANYRTALNVWVTSHLRTFRQKLMKAVPLQHNLEYHLNPQTKIATPSFYDYAPDRFQVYSHLELAGDDRVKHITDPLYLYDPTIGANAIKCYRQHEYYDEFKSRVKTPLQRLKSFSQSAKYVENYHIPANILAGLQIKYDNYSKCGEKTIYR